MLTGALLAVLPALAVQLPAPLPATTPAARSPAPPLVALVDTAVLVAPRLTESSGVAPSRRRGVYWTHNDSGDGPILYATDTLGRDLGFVRLSGARNVDWEDLAAGPCGRTSERCLYVGDIGDNDRHRDRIVVYRASEPEPPSGAGDTLRSVVVLDSLTLTFPGGPRNAEGLAVTTGGWLLIVTKDRAGSPWLLRARAAGPAVQVLDSVARLPITNNLLAGRSVTGADVSSDGRWLVVRTYVSLHFFRLDADGLPSPITGPAGVPIPVVESQGEAVAFDGDDALVLTSERSVRGHALLTRLRLALPPR